MLIQVEMNSTHPARSFQNISICKLARLRSATNCIYEAVQDFELLELLRQYPWKTSFPLPLLQSAMPAIIHDDL